MRSVFYAVLCILYSFGAANGAIVLWGAGQRAGAGFIALLGFLVVIDLIADWKKLPSRWERRE